MVQSNIRFFIQSFKIVSVTRTECDTSADRNLNSCFQFSVYGGKDDSQPLFSGVEIGKIIDIDNKFLSPDAGNKIFRSNDQLECLGNIF